MEWPRILEITEINDFNQFPSLKDTWNTILATSEENDIFSTWEWISSWWQTFGETRQLRIMLASDKDRIIAIAPFMRTKYHFLRFGNLTKIEFIGSPQSDYNNFILIDKEAECLELFLNRLIEHNDWNYLELKEIPENTTSVDMLRKLTFEQSIGKFEEIPISTCPYMTLPDSTDAFLSRLKGDMRRNLRRRMKRLKEKFRVEIKTQNHFDSTDEAMNVFFKLHQKRWKSQGVPGVFAKKELRDFHINVARLFNEKRWLSLYFLTANDDPIAAIYSFDYRQKKYEYLTGFDPDYSQYSTGNLLRLHVAKDCIQKGFKEYDLMRGNEPYKNQWQTQNRKNLEIRIVQKGLFAKIYRWATTDRTALLVTEKLGQSLTPER